MNYEITRMAKFYEALEKKPEFLTLEEKELLSSIETTLKNEILFIKIKDYLSLMENYLKKTYDYKERIEEMRAELNIEFSYEFKEIWSKTLRQKKLFIIEVKQKKPKVIKTYNKTKTTELSYLLHRIFSYAVLITKYDCKGDPYDKDFDKKMFGSIFETYHTIQILFEK